VGNVVIAELLSSSFLVFSSWLQGARGSLVVKVLDYKLEGRGFETR
jgi:hypothetical protein